MHPLLRRPPFSPVHPLELLEVAVRAPAAMMAQAMIWPAIIMAVASSAPPPSAKCQAEANAVCNQRGGCWSEIKSRPCGGPMVARNSTKGAKEKPQWRCYSPSTLTPDRSNYSHGGCFCSDSGPPIVKALRACAQPPPPPHSPLPPGATLAFEAGKGGYDCYRVPSLLALPGSKRILFAEGTPHGSWRPDIVCRTSEDAGRTWGPVRKLYSEPHNTIGNPSPVLDAKHGVIVLTFCRNNVDVLILRSSDAGSSWESKPTDISKTVVKPAWHWVATGPPAGVQLDSGRMVVCADHEPGNGGSEIGSHAMYSDDFGQSWNLSTDGLPNGDECSIAPAPNGTLIMNMRTAQERRQFSVSSDDGVSWSPPTTVPFPFKGLGNGCEGAMIRMPNSNRMVFSQPYSAAGRLNMSLHVSDDSGKSWQDLRQVDPGVSGYSALAAVNSTHVDLAWETSPILAGRNSTLRVCINAGLRFGSIRFQTLSVKTDAPIKSDDDDNSDDSSSGTSSRIEMFVGVLAFAAPPAGTGQAGLPIRESSAQPTWRRVARREGKEKAAAEAKTAEEDWAAAEEKKKEARKRRRLEKNKKAAEIEPEVERM